MEDRKYDVAWINPATGDRIPAKEYKGKSFAGEPPDKEQDWILHVSREGHKEGLLKRYKFESRPIRMQTPETDAKNIPFEIDAPSGEISMSKPPLFSLEISRATRATRELQIVWTAELTTGTADGGRVVGTGKEGTLRLPSFYGERLPAILMTALVTALAMLPLTIDSDNPGREIMGPMAAIIVGGLLSSTLLNLLVMPALLYRFGRFGEARGPA